MKKTIPTFAQPSIKVLTFLMAFLISTFNLEKVFSQQDNIARGINTQGGIFDTLFDHLGNKYTLSDLDMRSSKPLGGTTTVNAVPTQTCQAGYFTLYYAPGSIFTNSTSAQTVLCKVFSDISNLIISTCPAGAIKIYCTDTPTPNAARGIAIPFFSMPIGPLTANQGILDNQVYKYLISGQNPYASLPLIFNSNGFYYHGAMQMNPTAVWNFNMSITNIASNEYDAYSIMLHEVIHSLGFYSLITANGTSFFGANNNYYSRFDQFLYDGNGNRLVPSSTSTCPCNNLSFAPSTSVINSATSGCVADVTSPCSAAVQYISSNVNAKVYTPNCFESGSSLSHFEDMCPFTPTVDLGCATYTNSTLNNNLYYVMSNAGGTGPCYVKRHPKEQEKNVLCNLGYSVNSVYNSTVAGASYTYSSGGCNGPNIWGINDGLVNGVYTFTANTSTTNVISIPITTSIMANDSPNTATISCINLIAGNVTWSVTGGNLTFTANTGFSGPVIFRYMPQTSGSSTAITSYGGPTYVLAYFIPGNCPPNSCDYVTNGGFESWNNVWPAYGCGGYDQPYYNILNCWIPHTISPDVWRRNCNLSSSAPGDSHNGIPNDIIVAFQSTSNYEERIMNSLSSPLVPGQVYNINLFVYTNWAPFVLDVYSTPQYIAGSSFSLLTQFTINTPGTWTTCSATFTFNSAVNHNAIIIGGNHPLSWLAMGVNANYYPYIDDVSILPVSSPTFVTPSNTICGGSFTNLAQYASAIPGTFSGSFVTSYSTSSGLVYDFNASGSAPPGIYSIAFNYTLNSCPKSIWQTIVVPPQQTLTVSGSSVICLNSFSPVAISASLACSTCTSSSTYTWLPGNLVGAAQTVTPNASTIYTVRANNGICITTKTLQVSVSTPTFALSASSPTLCLGETKTISATGNYTAGYWLPGTLSTSSAVSPTVNTTYTFIATNSLGCTNSNTLSIGVFQTPTISLSALSGTLCSDACTLTATGTFTSLTWQPGNSTSSVLVIPAPIPTVTIYTVTALGYSLCAVTKTVANIITNCCSLSTSSSLGYPGALEFNATTVPSGTSISGPMIVSSDFTIQPGASFVFMPGEYVFTPNARIVVSNNASVWMAGAHLYSCGADLWQGILVKDGGQVIALSQSGKDVLIEDAVTAIDAGNQATASSNVLTISNTTFNKNYTDINIGNHNSSTTNYSSMFSLSNCVFTCRNFSFTASSWPNTSNSSGGLRYANPSITGLNTPYELLNAPITNLKNPYASTRSHLAIGINSLGVTTGVSYPTAFIGISLTPSSQSDFFLFDAHDNFVDALNSNVKINNCVFQNTQTFSVSSTLSVGAGINHVTSIVHNFQLDLSAPSTTLGNKFYDCHRAVVGDNIFDFRVQNATFRSTQSSTALTSGTFQSTGQQAIFVNTKQADNYSITSNEFTNIQSGVTINFYGGPVNANMNIPYGSWSVWPQTTYINKVNINNNTFSPEMSTTFSGATNHYVRNGVVLTSPFIHYIYTACGCNSVSVNNNMMYRVYNGVRMDCLNTYTMSCRNSGLGKAIANNTITVEEDFLNLPQKGIEFTNSQSYPVQPLQGQKVQTIENNLMSTYSGTAALSNQNLTLVHLQNNGSLSGSGVIYPTPHVLCNDLSYSFNGFVFNSFNQPASWKGNKMKNLGRGISLVSGGIIGVQGNSVNPTDNEWNGSWTGNWGTWVANSSTAQLSPLYLRTGGPWAIPTTSGNVAFLQQYGATGGTFIATGAYTCGTSTYTQSASPMPNPSNYESAELLYIANTFAYRFLAVNDSLRTTDHAMLTFYEDLTNTSIGKFTSIELYINQGRFGEAQGVLSSLDQTSFIAPETNYYNFYTLYLKYMRRDEALTPDDVSTLLEIANLCPDENGQAVYQSRALWQLVAGQVYNESNGCAVGGRPGLASTQAESFSLKVPKSWDVDLFPNPTDNRLTIVSKTESEQLKIEIKDLSNRIVFKDVIKTNEFFANLEFNLINGAYFINISNSINERVTKKLLIAR